MSGKGTSICLCRSVRCIAVVLQQRTVTKSHNNSSLCTPTPVLHVCWYQNRMVRHCRTPRCKGECAADTVRSRCSLSFAASAGAGQVSVCVSAGGGLCSHPCGGARYPVQVQDVHGAAFRVPVLQESESSTGYQCVNGSGLAMQGDTSFFHVRSWLSGHDMYKYALGRAKGLGGREGGMGQQCVERRTSNLLLCPQHWVLLCLQHLQHSSCVWLAATVHSASVVHMLVTVLWSGCVRNVSGVHCRWGPVAGGCLVMVVCSLFPS
jgi:hypothetical protein